jgi:hypothetical protein
MKKQLSGIAAFAVAVAILIAALFIANWVPLALQKETLRRYNSIEEVRAALPGKMIYVPSYFPQQVSWPPSKILAQGKPFQAIVMEFKRAGSDEAVLIISQAKGPFNTDRDITLTTVSEQVQYVMKGRTSLLQVGTCRNGEPCSRISCNENDCAVTVTMRSGPFELTRISESMLR